MAFFFARHRQSLERNTCVDLWPRPQRGRQVQ